MKFSIKDLIFFKKKKNRERIDNFEDDPNVKKDPNIIIHHIHKSQKKQHLREEFHGLIFFNLAMQNLLDNYNFKTVLDIGCGEGKHIECFIRYGKDVTGIDYGQSPYFQKSENYNSIIANYNTYKFDKQFDCKEASILSYGYNISIILKKKTITHFPNMSYDMGDIRAIKEFLPENLVFRKSELDHPFEGDIEKMNWKLE